MVRVGFGKDPALDDRLHVEASVRRHRSDARGEIARLLHLALECRDPAIERRRPRAIADRLFLEVIPLAHAESSFTVPMGIGAAVPAPYPSAEGHSPLAGIGPASGLGTLAARSRNRAYGIRLGPYLTIFTVPRLTGWAFGGAMSETMPVLKFITKMSVDQRTPVWLNHAIISILWPMGSAV